MRCLLLSAACLVCLASASFSTNQGGPLITRHTGVAEIRLLRRAGTTSSANNPPREHGHQNGHQNGYGHGRWDALFPPDVKAKVTLTGPKAIVTSAGARNNPRRPPDHRALQVPNGITFTNTVYDSHRAEASGSASDGKPMTAKGKGHAVLGTMHLRSGHADVKTQNQNGDREARFWPQAEPYKFAVQNPGHNQGPGRSQAKLKIQMHGQGHSSVVASHNADELLGVDSALR